MNFSDIYNSLKERTDDLSKYTRAELEALLHEAKEVETQYDNLNLVVKRDANSLYGVSASIYFSLVDFDIAEDITTSGKHFAVIVDKAINNFFVNWGEKELAIIREFYPNVEKLRKFTEYKADTVNDVCVYGDTDSRYIDLEMIYSFIGLPLPESDEELTNFGVFLNKHFISNIIKTTIEDECKKRNGRSGYLKMAHEVTTRKAVFQKKKKYIMVVLWKDGKLLKKPKIKFTGVELKRGNTSPRAKKILTSLLDDFLLHNCSNDDLRKKCLFVMKSIVSRKEKDFIYQITSVSGVNNIKKENGKYVSDKTHIQMQIGLSWLNFLEKNALTNEYKPIFNGQKVNYYYTKDKAQKVIGVPDDVDINSIPSLPEPDWQRMVCDTIIKPLLRYIIDDDNITDTDVEHFLLGVKKWKF